MAAIDFDATEVEPKTGYDALPAGKYKVVIEDTEQKPTRKGDGSYLQITFVVTDGEYQGRKLWARLNLDNPSDQAVGIARAELSAICRAVNVLKLKDSTQLHDLQLTVKVTTKPDKDSGEVRNEIKGYEPVSAAAPAKPSPVAAGGKAPWAKK
jgi:hypothetical protein